MCITSKFLLITMLNKKLLFVVLINIILIFITLFFNIFQTEKNIDATINIEENHDSTKIVIKTFYNWKSLLNYSLIIFTINVLFLSIIYFIVKNKNINYMLLLLFINLINIILTLFLFSSTIFITLIICIITSVFIILFFAKRKKV